MYSTTMSPLLFTTQQRYQGSDEILGLEKAAILLGVGTGCILLVLIFGIILCRLDLSAGNRLRATGIYNGY